MAPIVMLYVENFSPLTYSNFILQILARGLFYKLLDKAIFKEKSLNFEVRYMTSLILHHEFNTRPVN